MGHRATCSNQNIAMGIFEERLNIVCMNTRTNEDITAIMIGDFKMKFELLSSSKSTLDHYGKRGISWHGFCLFFTYDSLFRTTMVQ